MPSINLEEIAFAKNKANFDNTYYYRVIHLLKKIPGLFHDQIVQIVMFLKYYKCPFDTIEDGVNYFLNLKLGNKKRMTYWRHIEDNRIFKILLSYDEFKLLFPFQFVKLSIIPRKCLENMPLFPVEFAVRRTTTKNEYFGKLPPGSVINMVPCRLDNRLTKLIYNGTKCYFNPSNAPAKERDLLVLQYIHKRIFRPTLNGEVKLVYNKRTIGDVYSGI